MRNFPEKLSIKNKDNFSDFYYNRVLCYMRRDIYDHIISKDENSYFDIDKFSKMYLNKNDVIKIMIKTIREELENLGWKTKTSYGETALFIYSSEKPPSSCWEE